MRVKFLHLVAFDQPYPPDYGGVIDVFFKIKALKQIGIGVILHVFEYGERSTSDAVKKMNFFCFEVNYYDRSLRSTLKNGLPHISSSRKSKPLLNRLQEDDHPILFEGLHCCAWLGHPALAKRVKLVRMHNIEWQYYSALFEQESFWKSPFKKLYFKLESNALRSFEKIISAATKVYVISSSDLSYFAKEGYTEEQLELLPPFHANEVLNASTSNKNENGDTEKPYALYHGNLSVIENQEAALFLIEKVFAHLSEYSFVVAGKSPRQKLVNAVKAHKNIRLVNSPSEDEMNTLIQKAHIHTLPTFQSTGMKLKLLYALYNGRFCLVNDLMLAGTGLEEACELANDAEEWIVQIKRLMGESFKETDIEKRKLILKEQYDNRRNAHRILRFLSENHT